MGNLTSRITWGCKRRRMWQNEHTFACAPPLSQINLHPFSLGVTYPSKIFHLNPRGTRQGIHSDKIPQCSRTGGYRNHYLTGIRQYLTIKSNIAVSLTTVALRKETNRGVNKARSRLASCYSDLILAALTINFLLTIFWKHVLSKSSHLRSKYRCSL